MAVSAFTKSCHRKLWLFRILDFICLVTPMLVYIIIALCTDSVKVGYKVAVISTLLVALIVTLISVVTQKKLRCPIWIILIGLYVAIREWLLPLVIILAVVSILDDLVFTPIIQYYYTKTVASKTIDDREVYENGGQ